MCRMYRCPRKPEASDFPEMTLQAIVMWMLGTKLGSSVREASVHNH